MDLLAVASGIGREVVPLNAEGAAEALFQINLFQVLIAGANFVLFSRDHLDVRVHARLEDAR